MVRASWWLPPRRLCRLFRPASSAACPGGADDAAIALTAALAVVAGLIFLAAGRWPRSYREVRAAGVEARLARVHHNVYEALDRAGLVEELGADSFMPTPDDALPNGH